ncbi:MAG: hypothetical protein ACOZCL_04670 [Bacillota bacterium]
MRRKFGRTKKVLPRLFVLAILLLNVFGINYAYFQDNADILTALHTGSINPNFIDKYKIENAEGMGSLNVSFENEHTMVIDGSVETGYNANVFYTLKNNGTIPAKCLAKLNNNANNQGLLLELNQPSDVIRPNSYLSSFYNDPNLKINALEAGIYEFKLEIDFVQWNDIRNANQY